MRRSIVLGSAFFCLGLLAAALEVQAAPPANDQCSGAEIIPAAGPFPYLSSITPNIHEATTIGDPPPPTNCFDGPISRSIWYSFTPAQSALYTVTLKFTATTVPDTLLGIYTSSGGCAGPFVQYICNDDVGTLQSGVTTNFNAGTTYYIVVWKTLTDEPHENERQVQLKVARVGPVPNDSCQTAEVVPSSGPFPYWTSTVDTYLATTNNDPPGPCNNTLDTSPQRSVWFKFRPAVGGSYVIATCAENTATTVYNTMLSVYESTSGCTTLGPPRCNSGLCGLLAGQIMSLVPQTDYYIVVWDLASKGDPSPLPGETDVQLFIDLQGPPNVTTVGFSNAAPTSVFLRGEANPKGSLTRGYFEWGTTPGYGNVTANSVLGTGVAPFPFSRVITDQAPGTTIYYRAAAVNFFGTSFGEGKSVTLPLAISTVARQGNGLQIRFTAAEGYTYTIEASEDLRHWTTLGPATSLGFDEFEYVDPGPLNRLQRFYRIKL